MNVIFEQKNPACLMCKHFAQNNSCAAFLVIPNEILNGSNEHLKPLPNQMNEIVFEPINPETDGEK